jgi:hypothetical protein
MRLMDAEALLHRFRLQIRHAANYIADEKTGKYRQTIELDDARQEAALFTLEYLESGVLAGIERKAGGDPDQIDRYFLRELKCDMLNWAQKEYRDRKRQVDLYQPVDPYGSVDYRLSWPTLWMSAVERLTLGEIASVLGVSISTVQRRIEREKAEGREYFGSVSCS